MPTPDVVAGMRMPRQAQPPTSQPTQAQPRPIPAAGTVYESRFARYRVQIESGNDDVDPRTGRRLAGKVFAVQFEDFRYVNAPMKQGKLDTERQAEIDRVLQSTSHYGLNGDFWLASEQEAVVRQRAKDSARETLLTIPREELRAFVESLAESGELELVMPKREGKAPQNATVKPEV